jgi:hypothetical protein
MKMPMSKLGPRALLGVLVVGLLLMSGCRWWSAETIAAQDADLVLLSGK